MIADVPPAHVARTTAVGIGLREYQVALYRPSVRRGTVKFNVTNLGQDVHDFVVRAKGGRVLRASGDIRAGERVTVRVRLWRAGSYTLVCTLSDHEQRGMKARLRVR